MKPFSSIYSNPWLTLILCDRVAALVRVSVNIQMYADVITATRYLYFSSR